MSDLGYGFDPISPGSRGEASTFPSNSSYSMTSAGPSNGAGPSKRSGEDSQRDNGVAKEGSDGKQKKQKFTRSRTACLPCRSRKAKCGALPPNPCPNCIEAHLKCQWPAEDRRSSRARMSRAQSKMSMNGFDPPGMYAKRDVVRMQEGNGMVDEGWLDQLLAAGIQQSGSTPSGAKGVFQTPQTFATPQPPHSDPSTVSLNSSLPNLTTPYCSRAMAGSTPTASTPFSIPQQPFNCPSPFPSSVDPAQFIWAVSSRLPTVEESSPNDERSTISGPSPNVGADSMVKAKRPSRKTTTSPQEKIVKVTWWRPHGQTAITPGLKRITLKVRVDSPQDTWRNYSPRPAVQGPSETPQEVISPDGMPSIPIMRHLLDVFMVHFGCQLPFLDRQSLDAKIEARTGSMFLLNSIAAIAARFSTHPAIALPELQPHAYGNVFNSQAKAMLGSMLAVPSRETVAAFILLAHTGFANDSESEVWMMTGLAVRMSIDLGLHLNPPEESDISADERRLNRLVFWSVLLMDYALAFGVGRQTTYRFEEITQPLPNEEDIYPSGPPPDAPRSPFSFAAKQMISYGPLINMLNREASEVARMDAEIQAARAAAIKEYNQLPQDMQWNVGNLQKHSRVNQGSIFLHLHLWMHTILASGYLTGTHLLRRVSGKGAVATGARSGAATPNSAIASVLWRNSARTIGDILVLSDIISPYAYCALPFVNQAFFVAGCCYVKEIESTRSSPSSPSTSPRRVPAALTMTASERSKAEPAADAKDGKQVDLSRALLTSVATTNISTLQQGLAKQNTYWSGTAWILSALGQRIEGIQDVDLVGVTEKLASFVSLPDAGLVGRSTEEEGTVTVAATPNFDMNRLAPTLPERTPFDFNDLDFLSLPFDLGTADGGSQLMEQEVPLPHSFHTEWFKPQ